MRDGDSACVILPWYSSRLRWSAKPLVSIGSSRRSAVAAWASSTSASTKRSTQGRDQGELALETAHDRLVLRLDPAQLRPVLALVEQRTKPRIERFMEPEKP